MLKITTIAKDEKTVTLQLEGRIVGQWVHEVRRECEKGLAQSSKVILDLAGVIFVNDQGIKVLKALKEYRVLLVRCSPFLSALLEEKC